MTTHSRDIDALYSYWRFRIFSALFYGYALYYFTRKSLTSVQPALLESLGYEKADFGILITVFSIAYGISKFTSGILTDRTNPRYIMGAGLILSGVCNIIFGMSSSLYVFGFVWALNGWFQGFGAPPCARLLIHWYPQKQRGRWWSVWNTSHNVGGLLIAYLIGILLTTYDWRVGMYVPGVLCIAAGFVIMWQLRDTPESLGLPPVEPEHDKAKPGEEKESLKELLVRNVFKNPIVIMLAVSYFFVYVIRTGVNEWTPVFLKETQGFTAAQAAASPGFFEMGGFAGSLLAGWISDRLFRGQRNPVNVLMLCGVAFVLAALWVSAMQGWTSSSSELATLSVPFFSDPWTIYLPSSYSLLIAAAGFFIFGPQMLVGMAAAEVVDKRAAATATGFVGSFAYMGAAAAGWPLGYVIDTYGWNGFFIALMGSSLLATCCLVPLFSAAKRVQKARLQAKPA